LADQLDFGFRGVNRCKNESASNGCFCPSIHPKRIASTTQSVHVTEGLSAPDLKILTQTSFAD
jgi:hypothetical protein